MSFNDYVTVSGTAPYYTPHPSSSGTSGVDPWRVAIDCWDDYHSIVGTWTKSDSPACFFNQSSAQNDEATWKVGLSAGTWTLALMYRDGTFRGIATLQLDGVSLGTVDTYASPGGTNNQVARITGIAVATSGVKTLKLVTASKNASSTGYRVDMQNITLLRTA